MKPGIMAAGCGVLKDNMMYNMDGITVQHRRVLTSNLTV
jgi:hypothetical protein